MSIEIRKRAKKLLEFDSESEKIEHMAHMISFRFLSDVEAQCKSRKINRTELAEMLDTSKSYLTQLFRGDKLLNMTMIAKIENALNIRFQITSKPVKL